MENRSLLVSDLDGTLLGDDAALARFAAWYRARRERLRLVYASGRFFDSIVASIRATELPEPDGWPLPTVCSTGCVTGSMFVHSALTEGNRT